MTRFITDQEIIAALDGKLVPAAQNNLRNAKALAEWRDGIDCDGDLEIGRAYSVTGNPVVVRF